MLARYVDAILAEDSLARVPNQLLSPDDESESDDVEESSGTGAVCGSMMNSDSDDDR